MKKLYKIEQLEELKSKYYGEVLQSIEDVILSIIRNSTTTSFDIFEISDVA